MSTVRVVEGGRHPAVLDVPTGDLSIQALRAGEIKLSLVIPTLNESRNLEELVARLARCSTSACQAGTSSSSWTTTARTDLGRGAPARRPKSCRPRHAAPERERSLDCRDPRMAGRAR